MSALGLVARWLAEQQSLDEYGITFEVWGLLFGMIISNLRLIPDWLEPGKEGEFFIKVGLVLLGLDLRSVAALGGPGILSSWVPTPLIIIASTLLGYTLLRMRDERALVLILVCGACICGSSAATAIFGCVGGETETLTLCIAIINLFTIPQMIGLPYLAYYAGMRLKVAAAWFGLSVDATGAVVAAASVFDKLADRDCAEEDCAVDIASTVKIVQNILIGPMAVAVSLYWIRTSNRLLDDSSSSSDDDDDDDDDDEDDVLDGIEDDDAVGDDAAAVQSGGDEELTVRSTTTTTATATTTTASRTTANGVTPGAHSPTKERRKSSSTSTSTSTSKRKRSGASKAAPSILRQLWEKFPKFVLGFLFVSTIITIVNASVGADAEESLKVGMKAVSKWFFCLGFVGIGLSSDLRKLASKMKGGKPIFLYLITQALDLLVKLGFAFLSFDVIDK